VVNRAQGGELLVPAIASVVREVDVAGGRVVVVPQEEL
jgi:ribosomal 30S subunit maturation factor RimM